MTSCRSLVVIAIAMLGLLPGASAAESATPLTQFTASPERRAELLRLVRQREQGRAAAKAKGPTLTIVRDGQPLATIVYSAEGVAVGRRRVSGKSAATMLQEWAKLMSGVELPLAQAAPAAGPAIFLGQAAVAAGLDLSKIESPSNEGLRVKCDGRNIYIAGQTMPATVRAVGRFLEEEFGCRWFSDRPWGRVYPRAKTLKVRHGDFSEAPGMLYRRIWGPEGAFKNAQWKSWNGHGGISVPMSHSWGFLPKEAFDEHPEWFRLDENGKRVKGHWYNIGHPEVRKRFLEWAVKASDNGKHGISLSPPDDHREDFSPLSKKYDDPKSVDPSSNRVSMTNRFLTIANEAAWEIAKVNENALCGFYAYSDYTLPPTDPKLDKLAPNICIWIAPIRYSRYHPLGHPNSPSRQLMKRIVDGWSDRSKALGWRTYNYNLAEVMTPFSKITTWSHDLPYLYKRGCIGVSLESFNVWEIYGPHLYLSIRLSYDPRLDPWEIMADYWNKCYGPAAEAMEAYWMEIDAAFVNLETEAGSYHALHHVYTPERLQKLDGYLRTAEKASRGIDGVEFRVDMARRGYRRGAWWRQWYEQVNKGDVKGASETYKEWIAAVNETLKARNTNLYATTYLKRFIGKNIWTAWAAVYPKNAPPNKVAAVLPDEWRFITGDDFTASGAKGNPYDAKQDDSAWQLAKTFSDTLNAQGFPEYFGDMWYRTTFNAPKTSGKLSFHFWKADRKVTLYINGKQVNEKEQEGFRGATIDLGEHLQPGKANQITVKVRHIPLPELFLGGIVGPIYLIQHAPAE